jgi:hypothetical protein
VRLFPKGRYPNKQHERGGGGWEKKAEPHYKKEKQKEEIVFSKVMF